MIIILVGFLAGVLKIKIQPGRIAHSPLGVKETLNYMLREKRKEIEIVTHVIRESNHHLLLTPVTFSLSKSSFSFESGVLDMVLVSSL